MEPREERPSPKRRTSSQSSRSSNRSRSNPPNVIEFIDSQDPNTKSAIQRHTAYHSAAQRRDARMQLLRRGSQSRYFEWGRRPVAEAPGQGPTIASPQSSTSSLSISPLRSPERLTGVSTPSLNAGGQVTPELTTLSHVSSQESTILEPVTTAFEESVIEDFRYRICPRISSRDSFDATITYLRSDDACLFLLITYALGLRSRSTDSPHPEQDAQKAQQYFGRATNILWNRLQNSDHASSDANVQAVLLLVVYTADFGETADVHIHTDALRTMIEERGGLDSFNQNPILHEQLLTIESSRVLHLTFACDDSCPSLTRFSQPILSSSSSSRDWVPKTHEE